MAITIKSYLLLEDGFNLVLENYGGGSLLLELSGTAGGGVANVVYMQFRDKRAHAEYRHNTTHVQYRDKR